MDFASTEADIAIYGGAAGSGKSFALIIEPMRHIHDSEFGGVIFRRTSPQLVGPGSLWEEAWKIYPGAGGRLVQMPNLRAVFPGGANVQFLHLQYDKDVYAHQGKQYAFIGFDELTHFTEAQFWYLVSRMRTMAKIRPYMRCTTNPDPDSFVRRLVDWWIDEDGFPIVERSGVLRWFVRQGESLFWADDEDELFEDFPESEPMSLTFISAKLEDNPALLKADPRYRSKLLSLPEVERERLLRGNWNIRPAAGKYITEEHMAKRWPASHLDDKGEWVGPPIHVYTSSDYAVTEAEEGKDPDFTEHGVFGVDDDDNIYVLDWWFGQTRTDIWIESLIDLWAKWKPYIAFGERGIIKNSVEPHLLKRMRERRVYADLRWVSTYAGQPSPTKEGFADPSKKAKARRGRAFQARAAMGKVFWHPNAEWVQRVKQYIVGFPSHRYDDAFDVMANLCLGVDELEGAPAPKEAPRKKKDRWAKKEGGKSGWKAK